MKATETDKPLLVVLSDGTLKAQQEIDELALQLALGKAEAKDKFEELKNEFKERLSVLKQHLNISAEYSVPIAINLKIDELELRLQLGKVSSKETFNIQREALISAIIAFEMEIREVLMHSDLSDYYHHEAEKFLLKLEILRLKFGIAKFEIKDAFRMRMNRAGKVIEKLTEKVRKAGTRTQHHFDYKKEISAAYKHLKSAVKNL